MITAARAAAAACLIVFSGCMSSPTPRPGRAPDWAGDGATWVPSATAADPSAPGAPQPAPPSIEPGIPHGNARDSWATLAAWCQQENLPAPERVIVNGLPGWQVRGAGGTVRLRAGTRTAYWEEAEVLLGFVPQNRDEQLWVHRLDLRKTLLPLLSQMRFLEQPARPVVLIDPGHGGEDPGTLNAHGGLTEKHYTLDWGRRLQRVLQAAGWNAQLTRTNDVYVSIADRVALADQVRATVFVSLHFNSAGTNSGLAGLETYCLTPAGFSSHFTRGFFDGPEQAFPNNAYDAENLQLACGVHHALLQITRSKDRAVRRARFPGVLRPQQRPAILIEGGYLSNAAEAGRIADAAYRQLLAEAVARGLLGRAVAGERTAMAEMHP